MQIFNHDLPPMPSSHPHLILKCQHKLIIITIFLCSLVLYRILWGNTIIITMCLIDRIHQLTYGINRDVYKYCRFIMIGVGQVMIDGWSISMGVIWIWKIKNTRLICAIGLLFALRFVYLAIDKFPFPKYMIWQSPGFPSLVPYDHTRDFFYSGHTVTILVIFLQFSKLNNVPLIFRIVSIITLIYMPIFLIVLRVHYTIDVFGAILYTLFFYDLVHHYLYYFDWVWSLPMVLISKIYRSTCKKQSTAHNINKNQQQQYQQQQQRQQQQQYKEDTIYGTLVEEDIFYDMNNGR